MGVLFLGFYLLSILKVGMASEQESPPHLGAGLLLVCVISDRLGSLCSNWSWIFVSLVSDRAGIRCLSWGLEYGH